MKWIRLIVLSWMLALVATAQVLQPVNLGTALNDGTGDPIRTALQKLNNNDSNLWQRAFVTQVATNALLAANSPKTVRTLAELVAFDPQSLASTVGGTNAVVIVEEDNSTWRWVKGGTGLTNLVNRVAATGGQWRKQEDADATGYGYQVYAPTVTRRFIYDVQTGAYQYNHDSSIAYFDGKWFAVWNANTNPIEGEPGQVNVLATSTDAVTWSAPVEVFNDAAYSTNPVSIDRATDRQWQPSLIVVGSELWCVWMQETRGAVYPNDWKIYFSRLTSASGKWSNTLLNLHLQESGRYYYGFPTQNPIQLQSGRVLAPLTWVATNHVSPTPANWVQSAFWTQEKRAGVIYTDDGTNWKIGGYTTLPNEGHTSWEPVIAQSEDGSIRMWCRNLDYKNSGSDRNLTTAQGYSDGEVFEALEPVRIETPSSRLGHVFQKGRRSRHIGFANDWKTSGNFVGDRFNGALYFSRSSYPDLVPGLNFSAGEEVVAYPQGFLLGGKLYVIYSQGNVPRSIKLAEIDPAPDVDAFYISPRWNDRVNPQVAFTASPFGQLVHNSASVMFAVTNSSAWGATTKATVGMWIYRPSGTPLEGLFDCRDLGASRKGFVLAMLNGIPYINLQDATASANYTFSSLSVPTSEWCYLGVSIDQDALSATAYLVRANGTETSQTLALAAWNTLDGTIPFIGGAQPGSSIGRFPGTFRRLQVLPGVAGTANNHRYWHGLDQATVGATDWAGTETDPGAPFYDYWGGDSSAGSNDATWLAKFSATGNAFRGNSYAATVAGVSAVAITGTGSASVELPERAPDEQLLFGTQLWITNKTTGFDQVFLTIGDKTNQVLILSRTNNPTLIEAYSTATGEFKTLYSYLTSQWVPISVRLERGRVSLGVASASEVTFVVNEEQPRLFLGQGFLGARQLNPSDGFAASVPASRVHVAKRANQFTRDQSPQPAQVTINATTPRLTAYDTDAGIWNYLYWAGDDFRISLVTNTTLATANFNFDTAVADLSLVGTATRVKAVGIGTSPAFTGVRANGTAATQTPVTTGQTLVSVFGGGISETNVETTARVSMFGYATENWTSTANGAEIAFQVTPDGTAARQTMLTLESDQNITWVGTAPTLKATTSNGSSGFRVQVEGANGFMFRLLDQYANTRFTWFTNGVAQLPTGGYLEHGSGGPRDGSGSGAPSAAWPNGSTWRRTDGTGPNFYVRENGAWVAK